MLYRRFATALIAAMSMPVAAGAASFDCLKASTLMEQTICDDPVLSHQDDVLINLYLRDLDQLSPSDRTLFRDGQRAWIRMHEKNYPTSDNFRDSYAENLAAAYSERISELQGAVFRSGPYLFANIDEMCLGTAYDPTSNPANSSIATHMWTYPRIDNPATKLALAWNDLTSRHADEQTCNVLDSDSDESYEVHLATTRVISAVRNDFRYFHGGAHGGNDSQSVTLLGSDFPHPLTATDLFQLQTPWQQVLAALILAEMPEENPGSKASDPSFAKTADQIAGDPMRWIMDAQGLTIQFEDYEIGSYSFGEPKITVPWYNLRSVMIGNAPVP